MYLFANPVGTSQNMLEITHIGEPLVKYTDYICIMYTVGLVNFNNEYCSVKLHYSSLWKKHNALKADS